MTADKILETSSKTLLQKRKHLPEHQFARTEIWVGLHGSKLVFRLEDAEDGTKTFGAVVGNNHGEEDVARYTEEMLEDLWGDF